MGILIFNSLIYRLAFFGGKIKIKQKQFTITASYLDKESDIEVYDSRGAMAPFNI